MRELLLSLLIAFHLLAVNLVASTPLVSIWHEWHDAANKLAGRAGRALLWLSLIATIIGAVIGLLVGWLMWADGLGAAIRRVPSKIHYGVLEILFSLVLTTIQVAWWHFYPAGPRWHRAVRIVLAVLAGTNLIYHFPVLFSVLTELIHHGQMRGGTINSHEFRTQLVHGAVIARSVHFAFASIATSGIALMLYSQSSWVQLPDDERHRIAIWGGRWAILPTIFQVPIGLWVITRLSVTAQNRLMGGDVVATGMMVAGLLAALWLAHVLASVAFGETSRRLVLRSAMLFVLVVVLMTGASRRALAPISSTSGTELDETSEGN